MIALGLLGALVMGLVLGVIGGGGSILTVPILVFIYGQDPVTATGLSLFVVACTSMVGTFSHHRQGNIHWPTAAQFGGASVLSVFGMRHWLVPALPDPLFVIGGHAFAKADAILLLFAALMVIVAASMVRKIPEHIVRTAPMDGAARPFLIVAGLIVGAITGLLGAGGGFLIIPALVFLAGLDMRQAVGTSLVIIAVNAAIGFLGDTDVHLRDHLPLILPFAALAIAGILLGSGLSGRIPDAKLRPAFGWTVLVMGLWIIGHHFI